MVGASRVCIHQQLIHFLKELFVICYLLWPNGYTETIHNQYLMIVKYSECPVTLRLQKDYNSVN